MDVSNGELLTHLSLFSGFEGFGLGLRLAGLPIRTIGYVEIDEYCQQILRARIRDGLLDWAPIVRDIRCADFRPLAGLVDIITAGFPCQPHSAAGHRAGASDDRNLWPETLGTIRDVGPGWVLLENVPGILSNRYAGTVVGELAGLGYDSLGDRVPAAAVGAPHLRWRWFCLSYAPGHGCPRLRGAAADAEQCDEVERGQLPGPDGETGQLADTQGLGQVEGRQPPERRPTAGGQTLADADSQREQQPGRPIGQEWGRPGNGREDLADSTGPRHQAGASGEGRAGTRPPEPERRSGLVSDACRLGCGPSECRLSWRQSDPAGCGNGRLAHANGQGLQAPRPFGDGAPQPGPLGTGVLPDAQGQQDRRCGQPREDAGRVSWWAIEPALGRVVDGHPHRVDQVRALGNGIVPAVVAKFLRG